MGYAATPIAERFAAKIETEANTGCWLWSDAPDRYGYGRLQIGPRAVKAHRISFEMHKGPIPPGHMVCHRCDTPACVNPEHLFSGPAEVNVSDMMAKRRFKPGGKPHHGAANGNAAMSEATAISILLRHARGELRSPTAEARRLGMSRSAISRLVNGVTWTNLPRAEAALIALYGSRQEAMKMAA